MSSSIPRLEKNLQRKDLSPPESITPPKSLGSFALTHGVSLGSTEDLFERSTASMGMTPTAAYLSGRSISVSSIETPVEEKQQLSKPLSRVTPKEVRALDVFNAEKEVELMESIKGLDKAKTGFSPMQRPESAVRTTRSSAGSGFRETPLSPNLQRSVKRQKLRDDALKSIDIQIPGSPPRGFLARSTYFLEMQIYHDQRASTPMNVLMFEELMVNYTNLGLRKKAIDIFHQIPSALHTIKMCTIALVYYSSDDVDIDKAMSVLNFKPNLLRDPVLDFHWVKMLQDRGLGLLKENEETSAVPLCFALLVIQKHTQKKLNVITGHRSGMTLRKGIIDAADLLGYTCHEDLENRGVLKIKKS